MEGRRQAKSESQAEPKLFLTVFCCLMVPSAVTNLCILLLSHDTCLISYHLSYGLFNVYSLRSTQPCPPALSTATSQQQHCTHQVKHRLRLLCLVAHIRFLMNVCCCYSAWFNVPLFNFEHPPL